MKIQKLFISIIALSFISNGLLFPRSKVDNPEQTYIFTSQPYYLSGETIHYIVHLFDYETGRLEVPSQILVTELLDQQGALILSHFHNMIKGSSAGSYLLPDTLITGSYWIRAFTRYQVDYTENLVHYLPVYVIHKDDLENPHILNEKLTFSDSYIRSQAIPNNNFQFLETKSSLLLENINVEIDLGGKDPAIGEEMNLKIKITDQKGDPVITPFTIMIRDKDQFNSNFLRPGNLLEYRALWGEQVIYQIGGNPVPTDRSQPVSESSHGRMGKAHYPPQNELRLRGRYVDPNSKEVLSFRAITLTQTGQNPGFKLIFTDREGNFEFNQLNFTNLDNLLVLNAGENKGIILENEVIRPPFSPPVIVGNFTQTEEFQQYIKNRELDKQYKKFYKEPKNLNQVPLEDQHIARYRIYEKADRSYYLDDYIDLTDMREVIIELLPNVKIYTENNETRIKIFHHNNTDMLPDPLFLVNGRIVKDNDFILSLDNQNIDKIEVLYDKKTLEPFGPLGIGGVVAFYTKYPIQIPFGYPVIYEGYHEPLERIIQDKHEGKNLNNFPEFNPVLYWNPDCETNREGSKEITFYTNDLASDFEIIIEGITKDGNPFFKRDVLSVIKPIRP